MSNQSNGGNYPSTTGNSSGKVKRGQAAPWLRV